MRALNPARSVASSSGTRSFLPAARLARCPAVRRRPRSRGGPDRAGAAGAGPSGADQDGRRGDRVHPARAAGVATAVRVGAGAGTTEVDGVRRTGLAAGTVLATTTVTDRYDVDAAAGVF